jgi:dTDP-4-dehydrorhamnose 3,5-epimerase-like enzyme
MLTLSIYGRIFEKVINGDDGELFYIPEHYAHGFLALTDVEFQYITLGKYSDQFELSISLPFNYFYSKGLAMTSMILSDKDASAISYEKYFKI